MRKKARFTYVKAPSLSPGAKPVWHIVDTMSQDDNQAVESFPTRNEARTRAAQLNRQSSTGPNASG
jgi:hypothetical protein